MTCMTSVCIGVDFRKALGDLFQCADSFRASGVRSKSQKLESTISDWNQYWMQIESRFFASFSPSPFYSLIPFLPPQCAHDVRVPTSHSVSRFSALPATLPLYLYLSCRITEGCERVTSSIKKKWLTAAIDNERHFSAPNAPTLENFRRTNSDSVISIRKWTAEKLCSFRSCTRSVISAVNVQYSILY